MLRALVFDVDGTIAETEGFHREAFNLAFAHHGVAVRWDPDEYRRLLRVHGGRRRIEASFAERGIDAGPGGVAAIHRTKTECYGRIVRGHGIPWRRGVRRLMESALHRGLRVGIATTTTAENLEPVFAPFLGERWRDRLGAVVASTDVPRLKPEPDVYEEALRRLRVGPLEAVAFEDSAAGVTAACRAGLAVVATPSEWLDGDDVGPADLVVRELDELSIDSLCAWHSEWRERC